ncbi:hypothetical protein RA28_16120 [Ruegeria sp. ANG-S4]|nr:hypothetical protein RA28_16120 [Ruegeria sp. ANG-S4]
MRELTTSQAQRVFADTDCFAVATVHIALAGVALMNGRVAETKTADKILDLMRIALLLGTLY